MLIESLQYLASNHICVILTRSVEIGVSGRYSIVSNDLETAMSVLCKAEGLSLPYEEEWVALHRAICNTPVPIKVHLGVPLSMVTYETWVKFDDIQSLIKALKTLPEV